MAREAIFKEIGMNLRMIRDKIDLTMEVISKETGISRSYLSDFERGVKLPTHKYLKYLFTNPDQQILEFIIGCINHLQPLVQQWKLKNETLPSKIEHEVYPD